MDFDDEFNESKFAVVLHGEAAIAFVENSWTDAKIRIGLEVHHDCFPSDDEFSNRDNWKFDDGGKPFEFSVEIGEMSSLSIYRITPPLCEDCNQSRAVVFAMQREYRPAYCKQCAVDGHGYRDGD